MPKPSEQDLVAREVYNNFLRRFADDPAAAQQRMRRAEARALGHDGGPTAAELRDNFDIYYPEGPSRRSLLPDRFALLYAMLEDCGTNAPAAWQDGRPEFARWDALGLTGERRESLAGDFYPYLWEANDPLRAGQLFDRARLARWLCALLPGMLARVNSLAELQRFTRVLRGLPEWVWDAWADRPELQRLRYLSREESAPAAAGQAVDGAPFSALPAADIEPAAAVAPPPREGEHARS